MELLDATAPYVLGALDSVLLPAEASTTFTVTFDPQSSGTFETKVLIDSNDPETPTAEVEIVGDGIAPIIDVDPDTYDFGSPYIGCLLEQPFTITNVGNADLIVSDFAYASGSVEFDFDPDSISNGDLPWTIAPFDSSSQAVEVFVDYMAFDEFSDTGFLTVYSNDPYTSEYTVTADGTGTFYGDNLDIFTQPLKSSTDILFTLDRSGSMTDDLAIVAANFETFVDTITGLEADYHVAVGVEDDGCVLGSDPYIDDGFSASDAQDTFTTMADINFTLGAYGSNTERGYMLAEATLSSSNTGTGGCNEGFLRDDAFLSIIHVSDEPEQSVNSWSYYVSLFQSLKADPDDVVINAVAGDYPSGCGSATAGTGYYEGTVATGGLFLSICATDWASHLEELATESVSINDSFELTQVPVPQTIELSIDGIAVTTGWEFDASINSVVFETDYIPAGGATVEIYYMLMPDCEG
jgi:hypothetical protein